MNEDRPVVSATESYSPLSVLFNGVQITLISQGVPPLGGVKQQGWGGKLAIFEINASLSRKRCETRSKLLL